MEKRNYPELKEQILYEVLPNGLPVIIVPRPGFTRKLCYFATDFGSIHTEFSIDGKKYTVPAGIAHYLEHKLFDMPGRDVSAEFAAMGASVNAFTSYDMTAYHFSCTENFPEALHLLLEFVSTPYFTEASVAKEQGIIGQEIGMNEDAPDTRIFEQLMQAMYQVHPVREPILGTVESIGKITPESLSLCHRAFYRADNMLLCVVGDVNADEVRNIAMQCVPPAPQETVVATRVWQENAKTQEKITHCNMEVAMPTFQLGFKCKPLTRGEEAVRREIIGELAAEALFGEASSLYLKLYEQGVIDASFGGGFDTVEGMAMLTASGDSDEPETVRDAILQEANRLTKEGMGEKTLLRMKRSALGRRIRGLDSFDSVCFRICAYYFSDFDYFRFPALYQDITAKEILDFVREAVQEDRMSLSVIYPKQEEV